MESELAREQRRAARTAPFTPYVVIVTGCLLLALVAGWGDLLLVVMGRAVPGWVLSGALLLALLVLVLGRAVRRRPAARATTASGRFPPRRLITLPAVAAGLGCAFGALADLGAEYHVLEPRGPDGCRAVVRETAFLFSGSGEVYAVGATGIGRPGSSWTADDGYRPVASGTYELSWGHGGGVLAVHGTTGDPVFPGLHEVDCG
ncbi:hypothetical protein [Streptomyces sp. SP18CS02]|uniref:hypothetical protein n=1 Tax=Streptomyces sp. SP18CS02 TaxID=3002531 RepID=UPI002E784ED7|nr:hypothetical protein [Streptomyces sp. SP18CS02]MEE1753294.1 hypothetical protein [Streptomyces sp. SP18CS02]